jgi:ANTAR domain
VASDNKIDENQAFDRLAQLSQHGNMKLRDAARRLTEERSKSD